MPFESGSRVWGEGNYSAPWFSSGSQSCHVLCPLRGRLDVWTSSTSSGFHPVVANYARFDRLLFIDLGEKRQYTYHRRQRGHAHCLRHTLILTSQLGEWRKVWYTFEFIINKLIWINKVRKIILLACRIRIYSYLCTKKYDKSYADGYRNSD